MGTALLAKNPLRAQAPATASKAAGISALGNPELMRLFTRLDAALVGQTQPLKIALCSLLAEGHLLLEDLPGTGKTTLAKAFAEALGGLFSRVQFTPDLMPSDITGSSVFNPKEQRFEFHQGPVFCNVLLADEINRASPRTQSALLEAMAERQVSAEGKSLPLPHPFFVFATENPIEMHGTYPLPEAQLDRFMARLSLAPLSENDETTVLLSKISTAKRASLPAPLALVELLALFRQREAIRISEPFARYCAQIARATREHPESGRGASTRSAIDLLRMSQAFALLEGRDYAQPSDAQACAPYVLAHRISLRGGGRHFRDAIAVVEQSVERVKAP